MNLISLLQTRSKSFYALLVTLGIVRSLTNIGILMLINTALAGRSLGLFGGYDYLAYIALIVVSFLCSAYFQSYMVRFNNEMIFELEMSLIQKVRKAAFESYQRMGSQRIYTALGDARFLGRIPEVLITLINSVITLTCSLAYLFWTSPFGGVAVSVLMALLLAVYWMRDRAIARDMNKIRDLQDTYYDSLRELLVGFKQVRISTRRNAALYHDYIYTNRDMARQLSISTSRRYLVNELTGTYSWYVVFAVIIFVLPSIFNIGMTEVTAFITSVLFMMAPMSQLVTFFPNYNTFKISIDRINKINQALDEDARSNPDMQMSIQPFTSLRFENLVYEYTNEKEDQNFSISIDDFEIRKGEVIFIVGGNGSGKTTFINLLVGLYKPISGRVFLNGAEISWAEFHSFSNSMAVVFTDHHLFLENYDGHDLSSKNAQLEYFRGLVNMDGILKVDEKADRVDTNLSKGQQKRLALLLALLENKPLLVLDEWAAEQDPANRKYFYTELLDTLRVMGKTVVAISHDDDFYHLADRVVRFGYGKIVSDTRQVQATVQSS